MNRSLKQFATLCVMLLTLLSAGQSRAQVTELTDEQFEQVNTDADAENVRNIVLTALTENVNSWKLPLDQTSRGQAQNLDTQPLNRMLRFSSRYRSQLYQFNGLVQSVQRDMRDENGLVYTVVSVIYTHPQVSSPKLASVFIPQDQTPADIKHNSTVNFTARYFAAIGNINANYMADMYRQADDDALTQVHPIFVGIINAPVETDTTTVTPSTTDIFNTTQPVGEITIQLDSLAEMLKPIHHAGVAPLTESQLMRMGNVHNDSERIEDTGFYALAQNAQSWKVNEPIGISPVPYQELKTDYQKYQGVPYLIEGDLVRVFKTTVRNDDELSETLQCWFIEIPTDDEDGFDYIIVYLTDPPNIRLRPEYEKNPDNGRPALDPNTGEKIIDYFEPYGRRQKVKLVARFYKNHMMTSSETNMEQRYPAFVGANAVVIDAESNLGLNIFKYVATFVVLILFMGGFGYVWTVKKRSGRSPNGLRDEIASRRAQREEEGELEEDEYVEPENLPKDPLAALDVLKQYHPDKGDPVQALGNLQDKKIANDTAQTPSVDTVTPQEPAESEDTGPQPPADEPKTP